MILRFGLTAIVGLYLIYTIHLKGISTSTGVILALFVISLVGEFARFKRKKLCKHRVDKEDCIQRLRDDIKREIEEHKSPERVAALKAKLADKEALEKACKLETETLAEEDVVIKDTATEIKETVVDGTIEEAVGVKELVDETKELVVDATIEEAAGVKVLVDEVEETVIDAGIETAAAINVATENAVDFVEDAVIETEAAIKVALEHKEK